MNEECILGFWAAPHTTVMSICPNSAQIWRFEQIVRSPFILVLEKKKGLWKLAIGLHGCSHRVLWWRKGKAWCPFCPLLSCVPVCNKEAPFYHLFLSSRYGGMMVVYTCWSIKWYFLFWLCFIGALVGCWWFQEWGVSSCRGNSSFVFSPHHSFGAPTEEALPYLLWIGVCF